MHKRIVGIYDIHGNLPALDAVLDEITALNPDLIVVGGDVVSGPMPRETIERLQSLNPQRTCFVMGNADREVINAYDGIPLDPALPAFVQELTAWVASQLDRSHRDFLASFVANAVFPVAGLGDVLFCHATPRNDTEIITVRTPEDRMRAVLAGVSQPFVVCGHTHMQFDRSVGDVRVVNAGSVGMPYGEPGAYWVFLGPDVELRRTNYDRQAAADRIRATTYPLAQDFADNNVLNPPTVAEALAVFEPSQPSLSYIPDSC